jgi:FkbM family methyltransferase
LTTMLTKALQRLYELGRLATIARQTAQPASALVNKNWRRAMRISRWELIPRPIRSTIGLACDVGANRGDWTDAILHLADPQKVIAFEPAPSVYGELVDRFRGNERVVCYPYAVGAVKGVHIFNMYAQSELSSLRRLASNGERLHGRSGMTNCEVKVVALDEILAGERDPSIVKVDVQGFEREVLEGGLKSLARTRCLVLEVMYAADYYEGAEGFLGLATFVEKHTPLRLSCVSEPALSSDGFGAWADAVFVHREVLP